MIKIRPYRESDAAGVLALVRELQSHEVALYDRMKPVADMGQWYIDLFRDECPKKGGALLVAEDGLELLGYAMILTSVVKEGISDEVSYIYAHIGDLVVAEHARKHGTGRLLLEACELRARQAGRDELRLTVLAENRRARKSIAHPASATS